MSINASARKYRLLVGGLDYTSALLEAKLDTTELNQSGFITTTGTITLISVRDLPGSLDDRINSDWRVGQNIAIDVTNESGVLDRHPVGALRIISSEWDLSTLRLTLRVGCLLTLLSFKHPTEPLEGQDAEIINVQVSEAGLPRQGNLHGSSRLGIVTALLNRAGITQINCPYNIPYAIAYPIEPSGSYVETAGKILYSAGYVGWCDRHERIQIKPVTLRGTSRITTKIGGDKGDELWYRRLSSSEGTREIIKVYGMKKLAQYPSYQTTTTTKYGAAQTVDPNASGTIAVEITETKLEFSGNTLTTTTTVSRPIGLVIPGEEIFKLSLIVAEKTIEIKSFESSKTGKLLSINTSIYRTIGAVLSEYLKYLEDDNRELVGKTNLFLAETRSSFYSYDRKERPTSITTTKHECIGALLTGINQDWSEFATIPSGLSRASTQKESWDFLHGNTWRHALDTSTVLARLKPEVATDAQSLGSKLQLLADPNSSYNEVSSSGQTVPPAPERRPEKVVFVDKRVEGQARFSQYGGNPLRERERTYSIEYLESGVYNAATDLGYIQNFGVGVGNDLQCAAVALIEGQLLYGRFKGQDLGINLKDELFAWEPLMVVDCVEPSKTGRAFCLDDAHWYLGGERAMVNFGCIWIGDRTSWSNSVTVTTTAIAKTEDTTIHIQSSPGYIPTGSNIIIGGVFVVACRDVQQGDMEIAVAPLTSHLPSGTSATYTEETLSLPYVQVFLASATTITRCTAAAYPYTLSSTQVSAVATSGTSVVASSLGASNTSICWSDVASPNWDNMDEPLWNEIKDCSHYSWGTLTDGEWGNINEANWKQMN